MTGARSYIIPPRELTDHERALAIALGRGERPGEIAKRLGVNPSSISNTVNRACIKLNLYATRQLAEYARKQGWCA